MSRSGGISMGPKADDAFVNVTSMHRSRNGIVLWT